MTELEMTLNWLIQRHGEELTNSPEFTEKNFFTWLGNHAETINFSGLDGLEESLAQIEDSLREEREEEEPSLSPWEREAGSRLVDWVISIPSVSPGEALARQVDWP